MHRSLIETKGSLPIVSFESPEAWRAWLADQHLTVSGVWLKIAKKGSGIETVTYDRALDVALCYGWIDGQKGRLDDEYWLQRFTPRGPKSRWSKINRDKATALSERGEMRSAGFQQMERAKADGRWDAAYDGQRTATVPDDLQRALEGNERAREFFATLDRANPYAILYRILDAKTPQTRVKRIEKYIEMLSDGKTLHP